jgi:hypothetical protein
LSQCRTVKCSALRFDQVRHSLGLHQIQLTAQVSAAGELPGLRTSRAGREARIQYHLRDQAAAMTRQLDNILTRVACGRREQGPDGPIQ